MNKLSCPTPRTVLLMNCVGVRVHFGQIQWPPVGVCIQKRVSLLGQPFTMTWPLLFSTLETCTNGMRDCARREEELRSDYIFSFFKSFEFILLQTNRNLLPVKGCERTLWPQQQQLFPMERKKTCWWGPRVGPGNHHHHRHYQQTRNVQSAARAGERREERDCRWLAESLFRNEKRRKSCQLSCVYNIVKCI